jgi:UDP-N-acetylglucosamine diphosphorylase / glucose-1-phosphate thymidylyltransferase / UDP-N-acetylgalactosamine diphosphorylase / glucosamine-1-phosphate N-acetyltransferase / galactosamine-1-phosphate N-acetyltransferase
MLPLTKKTPKPLLEIAGEPLLAYIIRALPPEVDSLVVVVKYLGEQIRDFLGEEYAGLPVTYVEQGLVDGTGGALVSAQAVLEERFMVLTGDDLHGASALHAFAQFECATLVARTNEPKLYGAIAYHADGTLRAIEEKPEYPSSNMVYTSALVLNRRVFQYAPPLHGTELYLTDMVSLLARELPIHVVEQHAWCPVGKPEDIEKAERFLAESVLK